MTTTAATDVTVGDVIKTKRGASARVYSIETTNRKSRTGRAPLLRFTTNPHGTNAIFVPATATVTVR